MSDTLIKRAAESDETVILSALTLNSLTDQMSKHDNPFQVIVLGFKVFDRLTKDVFGKDNTENELINHYDAVYTIEEQSRGHVGSLLGMDVFTDSFFPETLVPIDYIGLSPYSKEALDPFYEPAKGK